MFACSSYVTVITRIQLMNNRAMNVMCMAYTADFEHLNIYKTISSYREWYKELTLIFLEMIQEWWFYNTCMKAIYPSVLLSRFYDSPKLNAALGLGHIILYQANPKCSCYYYYLFIYLFIYFHYCTELDLSIVIHHR